MTPPTQFYIVPADDGAQDAEIALCIIAVWIAGPPEHPIYHAACLPGRHGGEVVTGIVCVN